MTLPAKKQETPNLPALPDTNLQIVDQPSLDQATSLIVALTRLSKEIKAHYDNLIKPIKATIRAKEQERDEHLSEISEKVTALRTNMQAYIQLEEAKRHEEAKKQNEAVAKIEEKERTKEIKKLVKEGKVDEALALKEAPSTAIVEFAPPVTINGPIYKKKILDFAVEDTTKVPNIYWKPRELDTVAIRKAGHEGKTIPGIRFFYKEGLMVKA